jgi:anthranilate synthase component I
VPQAVSKPVQPHADNSKSKGETDKGFELFKALANDHNLVPVYTRMMSDQLTPVVAYQRLVEDDRYAPSFLFESVQNGTDSGRFSFVGAWPDLEILAKGNQVTVLDHCKV